MALLNALMHPFIDEGLGDKRFASKRTEDLALLKTNITCYSPEAMKGVCGIEAATIREVARRFDLTSSSLILWGMGIPQHLHGTDNARRLIALDPFTRQIDAQTGTGLHRMRGDSFVQGASDAGLIPTVYRDYQSVDHAEVPSHFETL